MYKLSSEEQSILDSANQILLRKCRKLGEDTSAGKII